MNKQRIFEFASGYSVAIKADYNPRKVGVLTSAWNDENPEPKTPQPPEVEEKIKGGTRKRKLYQDPQYLSDLVQHQQSLLDHENRRNQFQTKLILQHAIDPDSLNWDLIERARNALHEQYGTRGEDNDVMFYLNLVGDSGTGKPGDKDYRPNELFALIRFISEEKGPAGALVQHLLMTTFQDDDSGPQNGTVSGYLGGQSPTGTTPEADPAGTSNPNSSS